MATQTHANGAERLLGEQALARHGPRTALVCGDEALTYAELAERAARSAGALAALGVRAGERVLLLMRDTPEFAAAWLGALRIGAVAVALNNKLSEAEYRHILADSGARLLVVEDVFAAARPDLTAELAREGRVVIAGEAEGMPAWRAQVARAVPVAAAVLDAQAPAFMLYTSGTTGRPKGIVHTHRVFDHLGGAFRAFGLGEGDRILTTSRLFFAYGLEHGLLAPLATGATGLIVADWPDAAAVLQASQLRQPAALFSVPTLYRRLLAEPAERLAALHGVRRFVAAGERLTPRLLEQWRGAVGAELLNLYGMSETFCACMVTPPGSSDGNRTGVPLPGAEVRLSAERGVLWIRHPAQAAGYANLPKESAEQFVDGWFCTRDIFVRDAQGYYVHQGRADEQIKIAGQWVQPGELEEVAGRTGGIAEAACVPVVDADGVERLALFVTASGEPAAAQRAVMQACEQALPRHKRPKWIRTIEELPRTATGKVQRFKLREILERELAARD